MRLTSTQLRVAHASCYFYCNDLSFQRGNFLSYLKNVTTHRIPAHVIIEKIDSGYKDGRRGKTLAGQAQERAGAGDHLR